MSETLLWLNYCLSAATAFAVIHFRNWRIVPSLLLGTVISLALYLAASLLKGGDLADPWLASALIINGSFALIFAGLGAAIGQVVRSFRKS